MTLLAATPVNADTLTLPQQFQYEGLSFFQPLTFSSSEEIPVHKLSLEFMVPADMTVKPPENLGEPGKIVLIPVITVTKVPAITDSPTPAPSDTPTLTPSPSPTILPPTATVTPVPATPTSAPATIQTSLSTPGGLNADKLFSMANNYRQSKGLPLFEKDDSSCQLAASRAPEINGEIASGTMHSGLKARNLPYWNTENIISMNSEEAAFNWWINDTIHREAIEGNYKYSCVACSGNACAQEFTNFQPK